MTKQEMRAYFYKITGHVSANRSAEYALFCAAIEFERKACAQVCGDRAKAASLACDSEAYYEAEECEDAILKRSNAVLTGA